ncbi:MAG: metallophosphoesterase family protein [Phreatobacter sp.]|uniref:metallophosphoesterase family protein n=1 Tax=Phreatobacter sp. TaxID=1966341 RepID=UPI001A6065B1|nr:metallophosphoesterase [Phreatobacter sp.]MBL8567606.1 metallophosphoesterase family protein [Phreatobacter sp.]
MTVIAHLSDLHFGAQKPVVREALLHVLTMEPPDVIAISGDLTQNATHREFVDGRAFLDRLRQPCLIVPGNHDIVGHRLIERFTRPYERWRRFVAEGLEPEWSDDNVVIRGVNSARPFGPYLNWSRGQFSPAQIAAIDRTGAARRSLVVVAHHPVVWGNDTDRDYDLVTRGEAMLAVLARQPRSIMLLGHRHRSHASLWNAEGGEREARGHMTARPGDVLIVHAGTACSDRLRGEANSWNRLGVCGEGVSVETCTFDGTRWTRVARLTLAWGSR